MVTDHMTEGPRRRPTGIPLLTSMASLLDPRTKFEPGIPEDNKKYLFPSHSCKITNIARMENQEQALLEH